MFIFDQPQMNLLININEQDSLKITNETEFEKSEHYIQHSFEFDISYPTNKIKTWHFNITMSSMF